MISLSRAQCSAKVDVDGGRKIINRFSIEAEGGEEES